VKPYYQQDGITIYHGDCLEALRQMPDESTHCCVTSPPYWGLRDYKVDGQIGLEDTPEQYVYRMVEVFREVRRVLRDDGTLWLNLGDSYASQGGSGHFCAGTSGIVGNTVSGECRRARYFDETIKPKDLVGIPWATAFALRADGWYLRSDVIWHKPNQMPESVSDRPTKAHEYLFLLTKSERYYYDAEAISEPIQSGPSDIKKMIEGLDRIGGKSTTTDDPKLMASQKTNIGRKRSVGPKFGGNRAAEYGNPTYSGNVYEPTGRRNRRSVWTIATQPCSLAHFATFPPKLIEPCIKAGCPAGGTALDPFFGAGTTGLVCQQQQCKCIGIELNTEYCEIAAKRLSQGVLQFEESA
jgi:DNA modification methylase